MDQSQKPAEPTQRVSDAQLTRTLKKPEADELPGQKANRQLALDQLGMMAEIQNSPAFKWFMQTFVDEPFKASFEALRSEHTREEEMPQVRSRYQALKSIKAGIIEREAVWREALDPSDTEIARLRERLEWL